MSLETEYTPSSVSRHPVAWYLDDYAYRSRQARDTLKGKLEKHHYGRGEDEYLLLASHSIDAPLLVFIHGGYWKALSADDCCMWAPEVLAAGCSFASINYSLAPVATLERIVAQCRGAIEWLTLESALSPSRMVVAGSSAGGHLAAMCTTAHPQPQAITGAILISGVFDLAPLLETTVNDPLMLTKADAIRLSPRHLPVSPCDNVVLAWGQHETEAFASQSNDYAEHLRAGGLNPVTIEVPDRDHFDVIYDLVTPGTPLGDATLNALGVITP